jgi:hypothetical protein
MNKSFKPGRAILPFAQLAAISKLESNKGEVLPPSIGTAPTQDAPALPQSVTIQLQIWDEAPPSTSHIPTSRLAIAILPDKKGTVIIQQYAGRTKSNPTVWAKLPVFDLREPAAEAAPAEGAPPEQPAAE